MNQTNKLALMSLYRLHERQDVNVTGFKREDSGCVVRYISNETHGSFISDYSINPAELDNEINAQVKYFKQQKKSFEWKVYETDYPAEIGIKLEKKGFIKGEPEAFMALELEKASKFLFEEANDVVKVLDIQGVNDAISVQETILNRKLDEQKVELITTLQNNPESMSLYVVYRDNIPVSSARISFNNKSPFAGLWGGSTLHNYRKTGCYSDLLKIRAREARSRGVKYLTIDASEMSRPIVEKLGFEFVTYTIPYEYYIR